MQILASVLFSILIIPSAYSSTAVATAPASTATTKYHDVVWCYSMFGSNRITLGVHKDGSFEVTRLRVGGTKLNLGAPIACSSKVVPNGHYEKEILSCNEAASAAGNDEIKVEATLRIAFRYFERIHVDATVGGQVYSIPHCFIRSDFNGQGNDLFPELSFQLSPEEMEFFNHIED